MILRLFLWPFYTILALFSESSFKNLKAFIYKTLFVIYTNTLKTHRKADKAKKMNINNLVVFISGILGLHIAFLDTLKPIS